MARTVLITGAAGNIGGKLAAHYRQTGQYDLRLLDRVAGEGIVAADLAVWDEGWARQLAGVDTVIHLAADPRGQCSWADVMGPNVMGLQHVLRAAREAKVRRVIFASSVQVMMGYRFRPENPLTTDLPPAPLSPYGITKLMGEFIGKGFAEETGISFIAFRIGYFQRGDNVPGPHMGIGTWGQSMWLSNRDMIEGMTKAVEAGTVPYAVLNLESDNPGMRWDITQTRRVIGYAPQDGHTAVVTPELLRDDERARAARIAPGSYFDEYFHEVRG
jgi:uronate dehydrogenase